MDIKNPESIYRDDDDGDDKDGRPFTSWRAEFGTDETFPANQFESHRKEKRRASHT
jgi:hypothetical protein